MVKAKSGDLYVCDECGMAVTIEEVCTCDACGLVCCDVPMVKKAGGARKAKKKAAPAGTRRAPAKAKAVRR
jgi:hypothetical protein